MSDQPVEGMQPTEITWVPVYVERAICDLIPETGYAREIARVAWAWDDEHPGYENSLYRWQNEAIRQRRDLIALQELIEYEQNPYPMTPPIEEEKMTDEQVVRQEYPRAWRDSFSRIWSHQPQTLHGSPKFLGENWADARAKLFPPLQEESPASPDFIIELCNRILAEGKE